MEEKEYVIVSSTEPEIVVPEEIVYESTIVAEVEEINEVSVEENIYETAVIPEVPNVVGNEQLYVYVSPLDSEYKDKVDSLVEEVKEVKDSIPSDTSELNNNGDGNSPFATEEYVETNGGKIDIISLNGEDQQIVNKKVNLTVTADSIGAATKDFVNSSIETATATFKGTYKDLDVLKATTGDKNDYTFYDHTDALGNRVFDRYKHNGIEWIYEYSLNNSSFTDAQWKAINSGATAELINQILTNASNIASLNQEMAKTLKTPLSPPTETKVVGVDENNDQVLIPLGELGGGKAPDNMVTTDTEQDISANKNFLNGISLNTDIEINTLTGPSYDKAVDPRLLKDGIYYFPDKTYAYIEANGVTSFSEGIYIVTTKVNGGEGKCWLWFGERNGTSTIMKGYLTSTSGRYEEVTTTGFVKTGATITQNISCNNSSYKSILSLNGHNKGGTLLNFTNSDDTGSVKTCSIGINGDFEPVFVDKDGNETSLGGGGTKIIWEEWE